MQAVLLTRYGAPSTLSLQTIARPELRPNDLLVRLRAAALNPIDLKLRQGYLRLLIRNRLPHVLGLDGAGDVVAVGKKVRDFQVGDAVFFSPDHKRFGSYAQYIAVDQRFVARKPENLDYRQAASLPLCALTAHDALAVTADLRGKRVLLNVGSGGVGTLAIQLAKQRGANVTASCSTRTRSLVERLGADTLFDYRTDTLDNHPPFDLAIDMLGHPARRALFKRINRGGAIASLVSGVPEAVERTGLYRGTLSAIAGLVADWWRARRRGIRFHNVVRKADGRTLAKIAELAAREQLKPVIDRVFPLAEVAEAHAYLQSGRAQGKVLLEIP